MKYCILVFALACGSANATDVLYQPQSTIYHGEHTILVLSDTHSDECQDMTYSAKIITIPSRAIYSTGPICWLLDVGVDLVATDIAIQFVDTGEMVFPKVAAFIPVPGQTSHKALEILKAKFISDKRNAMN